MSERSAVVQIAGKQMRVHENDVIKVPLLADEVGSSVEFDQVLLVGGDDVKVGTPTVDGAKVLAEIVEHGRDRKIRVFKMKRRKTYRRTKGHRQHFTQLRITAIQA
ncbi:50S ribosomal protein L21 [bacterium]|nr:MAG: 50S ribosomal protein L21 [bacterium]